MTTFFSNIDHAYLKDFYNQFVKLETLTIDSDYRHICHFSKNRNNPNYNPNYNEKILLNLKFLKKLVLNTDFFHFY